MDRKEWTKRNWPSDATPDARFEGKNGAVAELTVSGTAAGYAMLTVQDWATVLGHLWWKRLADAQTNPELHVLLLQAVGRDGPPDFWFAHDAGEVDRLYDECFVRRSLAWEGRTYDVRWLDAAEAARVRAEWFWEPDED